MLMQMTSGEHSPESATKQQTSPPTPAMTSTAVRTRPVTPTSSITSSTGKSRVCKRNEKGETLLHTAAIKGDVQSTKLLIRQGADVNCQDFAGWTPLHEACNHGFYEVAKQLLKAGANVNIQGLNDVTPLHDAAVNGHTKVVELLLKHGADPLQQNHRGQTPMNIARSSEIIQLLKNEIIYSSSDMSTPEARSPTSPESSSTEADINLDTEEDTNQDTEEDGNHPSSDGNQDISLRIGGDMNFEREDNRIADSATKFTATGSSNMEQPFRLHDLDSRQRNPNQGKMSPLHDGNQIDIIQHHNIDMNFSSPSSTQSSSSEPGLFDPHLTLTSHLRPEMNTRQDAIMLDSVKLSENAAPRQEDSSTDSDSSDSSDTESTKSDNADHGCLSSSDSSSSSESDSCKVGNTNKVLQEGQGKGEERTDKIDTSPPKDRNIFSTIQQSLSPGKASVGKNVSTTYSIKPQSSKEGHGHQDRTIPKITIRLPQLSPKRDNDRKRPKDEDPDRPKETGRRQSPVGHPSSNQDRTYEKHSELDKKIQTRESSRQTKTDDKNDSQSRSVIVTSSHSTSSSVDDASEIKTLLLKPRETGRIKEANSPATSTSSESSNTSSSSSRRRYSNKVDIDHSLVSSSSSNSGKIMTRSATLEGVTTRSSGRNSPKVAPESSTNSEKGDRTDRFSSKEMSPARSGKGSPQTVSGKSSPKVVTDTVSTAAGRMSPSRSSDNTTQQQQTVSKLMIRVGSGENGDQKNSQSGKLSPKGAGETGTTAKPEVTEERPQRVTRTLRSNSQAQAQANNTNNENCNQEKEKEPTINVPLTRSRRNQTESQQAPSEPNPVESHPRKRKMARHREPPAELPVIEPPVRQPAEQRTNSFEMYLNIRQNVAQRHKNMCPVRSKPPQGFLEYLTYRKSYMLQNSEAQKRNAVPKACAPETLVQPLKELFNEQEVPRVKLRMRHCIEREKLMMSAEQEIMRVHGNAARAMANQSVPFSVCSILRDQEIYNMPEQQQPEEDGKSIRQRFNGRQFLSWLRDVDDKYEKIKETLVQRHAHEIASLYAVQKMEWECRLNELHMYDAKKPPLISTEHVPVVELNKDFDLLPA
ncbi:uncharacterized protein LOC144437904 [Glandiceps talaboti]